MKKETKKENETKKRRKTEKVGKMKEKKDYAKERDREAEIHNSVPRPPGRRALTNKQNQLRDRTHDSPSRSVTAVIILPWRNSPR